MKKFLLFGGLGLLSVLLAVYIGVTFFLGSIVKSTVNRIGPKATQSKVVLEAATISPLSGTGTLRGLTVGNPAGWSTGNALSLGIAHVEILPNSILTDVIVINELVIDAPEFNYETTFVKSNLGDLIANIQKYTGGGEKDPAEKSGPPKKFIVRKLRCINGKATVGVGPAALPVPLPEIRLDDIGVAEGGVTGGRLASIVLADVLKTVVKAVAEATGHTGAGSLKQTEEAAKQLGESVKDLFKKKP